MLKAIGILKHKPISNNIGEVNNKYIDEAILELETLQDKLKKAQSYIVDLENQLKNKSNGWMNK